MITLKQLVYALAVEETLHFKKASERCNISQSAMSTALSELETQLGQQIFERDNKKVLITPIGQQILERAQQIITSVKQLEALSAPQQDPLDFPISIGIIPTIAPYLLPKVLPLINQRYPNAKLTYFESQSKSLIEMVKRGKLDTAILALPYDCEGLLSLEFWEEDFYWVTLKTTNNHSSQQITSKDIDQDKLMLLNEGHCLKEHILDACQVSNRANTQQFGATSLTTIVQMVLGNLGTTLIPAMALESLVSHNRQLTALHLNEPSPHRRIAFIIRPNYTRISSIEALKMICQEGLLTQFSNFNDFQREK